MRYFLFVSLLSGLAACKVPEYKHLHPAKAGISSLYPKTAQAYQPKIDKALYTCLVEGRTPLGKHYRLSGLLFIKQLDQDVLRVVFQNQMGITYFDFGWDMKGDFQVYSIMPQMNKAALIKTLRKDFEMLLFRNIAEQYTGISTLPQYPERTYIRFERNKGFVYYMYNQQQQLQRIENADERKKVVIMKTNPTAIGDMPDSIHINHLKAHFTIQLTQLAPNPLQSTEDVITE